MTHHIPKSVTGSACNQHGEIVVFGDSAKKAATRLREHYFFRHSVGPEIDDIEYADGPVQNLQKAVRVMADKVGDRYTQVLDPAAIAKRDKRLQGIKDIKTGKRHVVWSKLVGAEHGMVGYVNLPSFYSSVHHGSSDKALRKKLKELPRKKGNCRPMNTTVLDLRGNSGGLVSQANAILAMFMRTCNYYIQKHPNQSLKNMKECIPHGVFLPGHRNLVVLINEHSASASNILAGVLRSEGRAIVVGKKSHPKCMQQSPFRLQQAPLVDLKYTDGRIIMSDGYDIQTNEGIDPDCSIDDIASGVCTSNPTFNAVMHRDPISILGNAR